jgi:L-cysteine S-thiosulfotransferase
MIRKSGHRFSEKIMLHQNARADHRFNLKQYRSSARSGLAAMALTIAAATPVHAEPVHYAIVGDAIPASLTGAPGDPAQGRTIVANRNVGLCLLCHSGPFPEDKFQGNLAPDLSGAGARWSEGQLRLRIVDASKLSPNTIMPPFYRLDGLTQVAPAYRGKPVLTAVEVEDVVAYLMTLK